MACAVQAAVKPSSEQVAMGLYNLEHLELLRDPITSTKCLVGWGSTTCVVAFRGTANKQNAKHDAKVHQYLRYITLIHDRVRPCSMED